VIWHRWFHGRWLLSASRIMNTLETRGLYRDLLDMCYQEGCIPDNREALIRIAACSAEEFDRAWPSIKAKFVPHPDKPGWLTTSTVEEILAESGEYSDRQSARAANVRLSRKLAGTPTQRNIPATIRLNRNDDPAKPEASQNTDTAQHYGYDPAKPVTVTVTDTETNTFTQRADEFFEALWLAYPAKGRVKKPLSQQYYSEKVRSMEEHTAVMVAVKGKWARSDKWAHGFVLSLPEWINQECWNEDPEQAEAAPVSVSIGRRIS